MIHSTLRLYQAPHAEDEACGRDAYVQCAWHHNPLSEIIRLAHAAGAKVLIDGCQARCINPSTFRRLIATFTSARATSSMVPRGSAFSSEV